MNDSYQQKACMLDISRLRVPTFAKMKELIQELSTIGFNQIFFNIEHVFKIAAYPLIGSEADGFTDKEFKELDDYAFEHNIELTPLFQSFGHMFHILKWDKFKHLGETEINWSFALNKSTYEFLDPFFKSLSETFRSKFIHVGGDEVYDFLQGKSKHLLGSGKSKNEIFVDHILELKKISNKYKKEIFIWGDMIQKDHNLESILGKDVNICYWNYGTEKMPESYNKINNRVFVCPGTQNWAGLFPLPKQAVENYKIRYKDYKNIKAYGFMITDWGDGGHFHPYTFTTKMFEIGYNIFTNKNIDPNSTISKDSNIIKIFKILENIHNGELYTNPNLRFVDNFISRHLFYDYIFSGKSINIQKVEDLKNVLNLIDDLTTISLNCSFETEFEKDLSLFIEQTQILGDKIRIFLDFKNGIEFNILRDKVDKYIIRLRRWFADYMKNWLNDSQPMGLYYNMFFIDKLVKDTISDLKNVKELDLSD